MKSKIILDLGQRLPGPLTTYLLGEMVQNCQGRMGRFSRSVFCPYRNTGNTEYPGQTFGKW